MVSIFTRKITDNLASLVKQIDSAVDKNREAHKMSAFVVYLSDDGEKAEAELKALAKKHKIKHTPLTIYADEKGPAAYKIAKDAEVTVMMWRKVEVRSNHSFGKGDLKKADVKDVVKDTARILKR